MDEFITITSGELTAKIAVQGAELTSFTDQQGRELMSSGDPAYWRGRAPLLFPIVGRLNEDILRLGENIYSMQKHGFARRSDFRIVETSEDTILLRLNQTEQTLVQYPFPFEMDARFQLESNTLRQTVTIRNTGANDMPFSFGFHPAFAWPLPFGGSRGDHSITFAEDEPANLCRVTPYGTIGTSAAATPVDGRNIALADGLFCDDALVWRELNSRALTYGSPNFPHLDIAFPDTPWLGIWTKPGAAFVCIEPWAGMADPGGYNGDFRDKPGIISLPSGEERSFRMDVSLIHP